MKFRRLGILLLTAIVAFTLTSCNNSGNKNKKTVSILYPNWAEGIAFTYLAKVALQNKGYKVELTNLEPGLIYGELSKKKSKGDVFMDAWLPHTHKVYWDRYGKDLVKVGVAFNDGTTGLVVPSYVPIDSITQLNAHKKQFDGKIIGIGSGAGIYANTNKAIKAYHLDYEQIASSGPAMVASLAKAIKNHKWIVITGWKPHYMWAKYKLKYLKDPKGVYPKDQCVIISRRGFKKDKPKAATFFKNFNLKEDQLYELMADIKADGSEAGAKKWYDAHKELVNSWFK